MNKLKTVKAARNRLVRYSGGTVREVTPGGTVRAGVAEVRKP